MPAAEGRAAPVPQHMAALARANEIRLTRAEIKRDVFRGEVDVRDLLESPPDALRSMTVAELLRAQRRWGRTRTAKLLSRCAVSEARPLRRLTLRQRASIIAALGGR
jgi:hypothetical protein